MSILILPNQFWTRSPSLTIDQEKGIKAIQIVKEEINTPSHRWHYYLPRKFQQIYSKEILGTTKYD